MIMSVSQVSLGTAVVKGRQIEMKPRILDPASCRTLEKHSLSMSLGTFIPNCQNVYFLKKVGYGLQEFRSQSRLHLAVWRKSFCVI